MANLVLLKTGGGELRLQGVETALGNRKHQQIYAFLCVRQPQMYADCTRVLLKAKVNDKQDL